MNPSETFLRSNLCSELLAESLQAKRVVCGYNYRFGRNASGDASRLVQLCSEQGISASIIPPVEVDGAPSPLPVSNVGQVRRDGGGREAAGAAVFVIDFEVVKGQQLGRLMGTPTLNQVVPEGFVHPRFGVYASLAWVDRRYWPAVTNFGVRPYCGSTRAALRGSQL